MAAFTKYHKQAFVKAVLADTPSVDYDEKVRAVLEAEAVKLMHPKVAAIFADSTLVGLLKPEYCSLYPYGCLSGLYLRGLTTDQMQKTVTTCHSKLEKLKVSAQAQKDSRLELREKLNEMVASLTTIAAAHKALPEFTKYLPAQAPKADRSLPVVSVLDTIKLLKKNGWPK